MRNALYSASVALLCAWTSLAAAQATVADRRGLHAASQDAQAPANAQPVSSLDRPVTVVLRNVRLIDAIRAIDRQAHLGLGYTDRIVPTDKLVTLTANDMPARKALAAVLEGTGLAVVTTADGQLLITRRRTDETAVPGTISGQVTNANTAQPIEGAEVSLEKTSWRARTDSTGRYNLVKVDPGTYQMVVRRIGYAKLSRTVVAREGQNDTVDLALMPVAVPLDSLVTTATGQQQRRSIANVISTINVDSVTRNAPIQNVSDLLANRVPGLSAQHTSGAPGDPTKIHIRGIHSILRSSDPVVYVNGVRINSAQSDARSGNLTNLAPTRGLATDQVLPTDIPAPSPLDQIDPNTIEKIEVVKGAAAATLYGADAANGVILITTKQGRPGPTQWDAHFTHSRQVTPGTYPTAYFSWGHDDLTGVPQFCILAAESCVRDSLVQFQSLNDPNLTVLQHGHGNQLSLTAAGGVRSLTYSITGTYASTLGPLALPAFEAARFQAAFNHEAPGWMQRPLHLNTWSVTSAVRAQLGTSAGVTLTAGLSRQEQTRSTLERQLASLGGTYVDTVNGLYYRPSGPGTGGLQSYVLNPASEILQDYYTRTTASFIQVTTGLNFDWQPRPWLTTRADAGVNIQPRNDETFLASGLLMQNDSGHLAVASGRTLASTFNAYANATKRLGWGFSLQTTVGANLTSTITNDLVTTASALVPGSRSIAGAGRIDGNEQGSNVSSFGWYIAPQLIGERISISAGLRLDGGSSYGARLSGTTGLGGLVKLPKIGGAWVISDEPWFPFRGSAIQSLKLMGSYGQAQIQPGPQDRLRLYTGTTSASDSKLRISNLGNTELRPERSIQFEGGFEGEFLDSRLSAQLALHHTKDVDKILDRALPGSVDGGATVRQNIGDVLNTGVELDLTLTPVRRSAVRWSVNLRYAKEDNKLVKLGKGVDADPAQGIVEGYPLFSRWARPILGYGDQNGDGILQYSEIQLGDSLVFMGRLLPRYTTAFGTNLELFGGAIGIAADFSYLSGATQVDQTARANWVLARPLFDPTTSFAEQAAVLASTKGPNPSDYGLTRDVSTLRFNSLSVGYRVPAIIAQRLGARQLRVAVQGSNLAMHSTYNGRDPDVSAWSPGESVVDAGQLPQPRLWQIRVDVSY